MNIALEVKKVVQQLPVGGLFNKIAFREAMITKYQTDFISDSLIEKDFRNLRQAGAIDYENLIKGGKRVNGVFVITRKNKDLAGNALASDGRTGVAEKRSRKSATPACPDGRVRYSAIRSQGQYNPSTSQVKYPEQQERLWL